MISALVVHRGPQPGLALALSRLVEGALAGLLADVRVLDMGSDPLADKLAEDGGCALTRAPAGMAEAHVLEQALAAMKADWALICPSDLAPARGWAAAARDALALAQAGAPLTGAALLTPPRGWLRRRRAIALVRRSALASGALSGRDVARAALSAAARTGPIRPLERQATCEDG
jgi:hypothetical protein